MDIAGGKRHLDERRHTIMYWHDAGGYGDSEVHVNVNLHNVATTTQL